MIIIIDKIIFIKFIEDEKTTPKYIIKEINNQVYWYCRIEDDMFRVMINYGSQTGTIIGL